MLSPDAKMFSHSVCVHGGSKVLPFILEGGSCSIMFKTGSKRVQRTHCMQACKNVSLLTVLY